MKYAEYRERTSFTKDELVAQAIGELIEDPPFEDVSRLPAPPFLMVDRITNIEKKGQRGLIVGEKDVVFDEWFFQCHFRGDPVQPGCLGVDAIWQMLGFFCAVSGARGVGRALGCQEVTFLGQIRPFNRVVRYEIEVRRYSELPSAGMAVAIGNGTVLVDDEVIYTVRDAKVGMFEGIRYADYPRRSANSVGGLLKR
jgi:3-hydroxyacyl-[acyl-carrier protein] dehydratase/trans-2-decenoyl-[acyl-carrier protein] isomerase